MFRFEKWWLSHLEPKHIIDSHLALNPDSLIDLLKRLHCWGFKEMRHFDDLAFKVLEDISSAIHKGDQLQEAIARTKLLGSLKDQESFWLQRS